MSTTDSNFLGKDEPVAQVLRPPPGTIPLADWLSALLGLEPIPEQSDAADEAGDRLSVASRPTRGH